MKSLKEKGGILVTLKELIKLQKCNDMNDMEEEGMELIHNLTKIKVEKLKIKHHAVEEWACVLPSKYLYENYDLYIADKLHMLMINYLVNGYELSDFFKMGKRECSQHCKT